MKSRDNTGCNRDQRCDTPTLLGLFRALNVHVHLSETEVHKFKQKRTNNSEQLVFIFQSQPKFDHIWNWCPV